MAAFVGLILISLFPGPGRCNETATVAQAPPFAFSQAKIPSLIETIQFKDEIKFCNVRVPLEIEEVRQRLEKEMLLILWNRPQVILWLKRSGKYFPIIEEILSRQKLPLDLKYVPVVESALRPHVKSSAGAVGFWQFIRSTGKKYGLTINKNVDQRRNIFDSTHAACRYIHKLYGDFNSYLLAMAAYNMGEYGLRREINAQENTDYFSLYLPKETQRYILRMIAVKLIFEHPEDYGFYLKKSDYYPAFTYSRLDVKSKKSIPLLFIAKAARIPFKTVKDMNPHIRGYTLVPGRHAVLVPEGNEKGFKNRFAVLEKTLQTSPAKNVKTKVHVVRPGESLSGIAKKYDISLYSLLQLNHFTAKQVIHPGDRLVVK